MWPAEAFNLALKAQNFAISASVIDKNMGKNISIMALECSPKNIWPAMRFELCIPVLNHKEDISCSVELYWILKIFRYRLLE